MTKGKVDGNGFSIAVNFTLTEITCHNTGKGNSQMPAKQSNADHALVDNIERMLASANIDTRAAVAALALPGRIRAFSPHYAALVPKDQARLSGLVHTQMCAGQVDSATGISAALAMNWCEARGLNYRLTRIGDIYKLERLLP